LRRLTSTRLSLAVLLAALLVPALPAATLAGTTSFSASAGLTPIRQLVGDSAGSTFTLTVHNTGNSAGIGAIEIKRPSSFWAVMSCGSAPTGWSVVPSVDRCRYISAAGSDDNIFPGDPDFPFVLVVSTAASTHDVGGKWSVLVSQTEDFDNIANLAQATPMGFGLKARTFSFQITDVVIADAPLAIGASCPAPNRTADPGSTHTLVVCGSNRTTQTQTLKAKYAGLKGTFIGSHGGFTSAPVLPGTASVVIGAWANVNITGATGSDMTILARVRSAAKRTSGWKTLVGYSTETAPPVNQAPSALGDSPTTNEDQATVVDVLTNDSDPDGSLDPTSVTVTSAPTNGGVSVNAITGAITYTPSLDFHGSDSFKYTVKDTLGATSNEATVNVTVNPVNDAPFADDDSASTTTTTPINPAAPGVLAGDTDSDGDSLTAVLDAGPSHAASFTLNADGSFSYQAVAGFTGVDSFMYHANDGTADSNIATVNITVNSAGGGGGGGGCLIVC